MRNHYFQARRLSLLLTTLASCVILGCGGGGSTLSGSATYNAEPIAKGQIVLRPTQGTSGAPLYGSIENGQYTLSQVPLGKFQVVIIGEGPISDPMLPADGSRPDVTSMRAPASSPTASPYYIAEDADGNSQTIETTGGSQTKDFAITGAPRPK